VSSVFRSGGGTSSVVLKPGVELPGAGALADVEEFVASGRTLTFLGRLADGTHVLARTRDGATSMLGVEISTGGGTALLTLGGLLAVRGNTVVAGGSTANADGVGPEGASGLLLSRGRAPIRSILAPRRGDFGSPSSAAVASRGIVVLGDGPDVVYALRGQRLRPIVTAGKGVARDVVAFDAMVASGSNVFVTATDATDAAFLYEVTATGFLRVLVLPSLPAVLAADRGTVAMVVTTTLDGGMTVDQLWRVRNGLARTLASLGDATPLGTLSSFDGIALDRGTVAVAASVAGVGPHHALLIVE
jgi:hypothetical protein